MSFVLGRGSRLKLIGVRPNLVQLVELAITMTPVDLTVTDGVRTKEQQALNVARGVSNTTNSRHLTGDAIDVCPWVNGGIPWPDPRKHTAAQQQELLDRYWWPVAHTMFEAADKLGMLIQWGNDWDLDGVPVGPDPDESLVDFPHWQNPWPYRIEAAKAAAARREMLRKAGAQKIL